MYRRNLNISSIKIKEQAYKAFVRPILGYASTVWDPHLKKDIAKLEQVQRRAARFVKQNYHNRSRVTKLLEELNWMPLVDRRKNARLVMFYKIKNQKVAINFDSNVKPSTRSTRSFMDVASQCTFVPHQSLDVSSHTINILNPIYVL